MVREETMHIERIAAFAQGEAGGNPAGVVIVDSLPATETMQAVAADVGYSETVFAEPDGAGWRVRYFSPQSEVPFCGHATIALGAALAGRYGAGNFALALNAANIVVEGCRSDAGGSATLISPMASNEPVPDDMLAEALDLFDLTQADLDMRIAPAITRAGATHLLLPLVDRSRLAAMRYPFEEGRAFMRSRAVTTINLVVADGERLFHSRNAFASGGIVEDPATGAAAAAFGGYLRAIGWPHGGEITVLQGEDMGMPSRIVVAIGPDMSEGLRVSGATRSIAS